LNSPELLRKRKLAVISAIQDLDKAVINRGMIWNRLRRNGFPMNEINPVSIAYILRQLTETGNIEKTNIGSFYRIKTPEFFDTPSFYHGAEDDYPD